MYDIGEVDGLQFLTMEFIDGEDLASLLRRIKRLPPDKAVEIARQLCAGSPPRTMLASSTAISSPPT